jgi:outer membrane protein OmpA-like peptidoglycan-associated protein
MRWLLPLLGLAACVVPSKIVTDMEQTEATIDAAHQVYAPLCAPREIAIAQANLDFTRIELSQGVPRRAAAHLATAYEAATLALEKSTPCGGADGDNDTVPDVVDLCPTEVEDLDGELDGDGCRDLDPYTDADGDGVINFEDGCVDEPEDFDGDSDADGCPETSEDADGDGVVNVVDVCPNEPEDLDAFKDVDGCPDPDNDGDSVADIVDGCPLVDEDVDGWNDEDGCPDPDNDLDGVPDVNDACANEPGDRDRQGCPLADADKDGIADANDRCPDIVETVNGYLDEDGCPDQAPSGVRVTRTKVEITETIQFETASATLLASSHGILDNVYQVLVDAPYLRLRIEGHTDAEGSDEANLTLSEERARSVRVYLESKGIESSRLESVGHGESRPIDTNRTASGRTANRRVEFLILRE